MANNIHKNHKDFFQFLKVSLFVLAVAIIAILCYYVINSTTSTNSKAAGINCFNLSVKQCPNYASIGCQVVYNHCSYVPSGSQLAQTNQKAALANNVPSGTTDCSSYSNKNKCLSQGQCTWNGYSCVQGLSSKSQLVTAYLKKYNLSLCSSLQRPSGPDGKCLPGLECNGGVVPFEGNSFTCANPYATNTLNCCPKDCVLDAIPGAGVNVCLTRYR